VRVVDCDRPKTQRKESVSRHATDYRCGAPESHDEHQPECAGRAGSVNARNWRQDNAHMTKSKTKTVTLMAAMLLAAVSAHAQTVTFTDINDAVPGKFFDAASSVPEPTDLNTLVIGLNTGLDGTIWKHRDFQASLLPFSYSSATYTISCV